MWPVRLELLLRTVSKENFSLAAAVNEYMVRVKNLAKKVGEEELNRMTLPRELEQSKQEVERLDCEKELLQQRRERPLENGVPEAGTSVKFVQRSLETQELQYVGLVAIATERIES